jgi:transaldolase
MTVFAQVVADTADGIVEEAKALAGLHRNIVVKVHTNSEGTAAIRRLRQLGIRTCATGIHSVIEALAVEKAGADHAAIFIGLLGEVDENPTDALISGIRRAYDNGKAETRIMAAVRSVGQLVQCACSGADEMTAPHKIWKLFFQNGYTRDRWNAFIGDWKKAYGDRDWITGY